MRASPFPYLLGCALMAGCAQEGVVVQKLSRPAPFYLTAGIDGSYRFILRDAQGIAHSQLVTPEVFERYADGDQFDDLQAAPIRRLMDDPKDARVSPQHSGQRRHRNTATRSDN